MFKFFVIICFCSFALAEESSECDCDILQIHSEDDPKKYYNFSKKWDIEGEQSFYFSIEHHLMLWNNISNKYENASYQIRKHHLSCPNVSQKFILKFPWPGNESKVFESQCLKDNKCLANKHVTGKYS